MPIDATVNLIIEQMKETLNVVAAKMQLLEAEKAAAQQEFVAALQPLASRLAVLSGTVAEPEPEPVSEPIPEQPAPAPEIVVESVAEAESVAAAAA